MPVLLEKILIYGAVGLFLVFVFYSYIRRLNRKSKVVEEKIKIAKEEGLHEPVSLHPVVDVNSCIQTGACILACPEHDILGIRNGKATTINASRCIGHGACFHACPTQAITLCIGTEKRGVDLPQLDPWFETNVKGIYIAGEMGGMGLIKNAVEQGKQAVANLSKGLVTKKELEYELVIVGAGPAGISASLEAKRLNLNFITLEQDSLGGTVFSFPREKVVMTSALDLPLYGKVKLVETSKTELLNLWSAVLKKHHVEIKEHQKVESIKRENGSFILKTREGSQYVTQKVLLATGRRGTPRKLNIQGEELPKVFYRLLDPERIHGKKIIVVGGGDSAVESALLLADENEVTLSYRQSNFSRLKQKNTQRLNEAVKIKKLKVLLNSAVVSIEEFHVWIKVETMEPYLLDNDLIYIFAGGELPVEFLKNTGIEINRKFGEAVLSHVKKIK